MLKVINKRWPLVKVYVINSLVQGKESAYDIAYSIKIADKLNFDVIIIGRGGGSLEDLWGFNEEIVADAIFEAKTPIVSAVGHEIDFLISDFVADLRAPTPSAAIEMILPDKEERFIFLDSLAQQLSDSIKNILKNKKEQISTLYFSFEQVSLKRKIEFLLQNSSMITKGIERAIMQIFQKEELKLSYLKSNFEQINFVLAKKESLLNEILQKLQAVFKVKTSKNGFAQVVKNNKIVSLKELKIGDEFLLQDLEWVIEGKVIDKKPMQPTSLLPL